MPSGGQAAALARDSCSSLLLSSSSAAAAVVRCRRRPGEVVLAMVGGWPEEKADAAKKKKKKSHPRPAEEAKIKEVSARGRTACETTAYKGNGQRGTRPVHDNDLTMRTGESRAKVEDYPKLLQGCRMLTVVHQDLILNISTPKHRRIPRPETSRRGCSTPATYAWPWLAICPAGCSTLRPT